MHIQTKINKRHILFAHSYYKMEARIAVLAALGNNQLKRQNTLENGRESGVEYLFILHFVYIVYIYSKDFFEHLLPLSLQQ